MDSIKNYTTNEVSKMLNIKIATLLLYARNNNVAKKGSGTHIRYIWLDIDIENFKKYSQDPFKYNHKDIKPTENYNTLYVRLKRAKQKNDTERIELYTKQIEELLKQKKRERAQQENLEKIRILKDQYPEKLQENK